MKVYNVVRHTALLGEGPVWDNRSNSIIWLDILKSEIHQFNPQTNVFDTIQIGDFISAVAVRGNGGFIAAAKKGFGWLDLKEPSFTYISQPEKDKPNNRFNDGKCDPAGRFWAGTMSEVAGVSRAGALYVLDQNCSVSVKIQNVSCSNGLSWNLEQKTFYFIDTPTRQVVAYDYELDTGKISNKRLVISIPEEEGIPDGMTIDTEGMLWIAHWDGWKVSRWNPFTGERLLDIYLPTARITSCVFGGVDLQDLYITSAKIGLSDAELEEQPLAGSLFVVKNIGYTGMPAYSFIENSKS